MDGFNWKLPEETNVVWSVARRERLGVRKGTRSERGTRLCNVPGEREREREMYKENSKTPYHPFEMMLGFPLFSPGFGLQGPPPRQWLIAAAVASVLPWP